MVETGIKAVYSLKCKNESDSCIDVARKIARRQSIGDYGEFEPPAEVLNFEATVSDYKNGGIRSEGTVTVNFPIENFDASSTNIPALLNILAGDIFGWEIVEDIKLEDILLPTNYMSLFQGPRFGLNGIRDMLDVEKNRPMFGVTIRPSLGLSPEKIAKMAKLAVTNGANFFTDDEKLVNPSYCGLMHRAKVVSDALSKVESKSGRKSLYMLNISQSADKICKSAESVQSYPHIGLMVCFVTGGYGCLQALAENDSINSPIWAHRTMHAAFSRKPHGISAKVLATLCRVSGADFQHIGPVPGTDVVVKGNALAQKNTMTKSESWCGLKPSLPAITGGVKPEVVHSVIDLLGSNIAFAVGNAIVDHPQGFEKGVIAMKQAIDCAVEKIPPEECAEKHSEYDASLRN